MRNRGFSLIELAIVLLIATLILGGMLIPFSAQIQRQRIATTQKTLDEIKEAIIGFAVINKRLPRPATDSTNGTSKATCPAAADCTGFIPWATLGVNKIDAWGKLIRYSVHPDLATGVTFPPTTATGYKTIQTRDGSGALVNEAQNVPVVLLSYGVRNHGTSESGVALTDDSSTNTDEDTNNTASYTAPTTFITRVATDNTAAPGGEFDDIVVWISTEVILNKMIAAIQLN